MYVTLLFIHSWFRYLVLALGLGVIVIAIRGMRRGAAWGPADERVHLGFIAALDIQLIFGLLLYFVLSPVSAAALANMGAAMKDPQLRYFGVEHIATMLIAITVAHIGRIRSKRKAGRARYRSALVAQLLWLVLTLLAIPWPGLDTARPVFRM